MKKTNAGFTLIEVLVTVAILAIALTAIIKATSQNIKDNIYLQNKTIANWVATRVINEVRVGLIKLPAHSDGLTKQIEMLNRKWIWQAEAETTPNPHILRIKVIVHPASQADVNLAQLESYLYVP